MPKVRVWKLNLDFVPTRSLPPHYHSQIRRLLMIRNSLTQIFAPENNTRNNSNPNSNLCIAHLHLSSPLPPFVLTITLLGDTFTIVLTITVHLLR
ncbi:hypothetical protein TYRP_023081 [Tyrophagus putrescentiae]|nr:hypothetical protein TYRP_023081 [Tyrophagus putrescentiae]